MRLRRSITLWSGIAALLVGPPMDAICAGPQEMIRNVRRAMVLVEVDRNGEYRTCSGCLVGANGRTGFILASSHLLLLGKDESQKITLRFLGTPGEVKGQAEVLLSDPERGLALLEVRTDGLPDAVSLKKRAELAKSVPVFLFGFDPEPKGSEQKPKLAVVPSMVTHVKKDLVGTVYATTINTVGKPGMIGGPVFDSTGGFAGVMVSGSDGKMSGEVVPSAVVAGLLAGRIGEPVFGKGKATDTGATFAVTAKLLDPLDQLQTGELLVAVADDITNKPKRLSRGNWTSLKPHTRHSMDITGDSAVGSVTLRGDPGVTVRVKVQVRAARRNGAKCVSRPYDWEVVFPQRKGAPEAADAESEEWLGVLSEQEPAPPADKGGSRSQRSLGGLVQAVRDARMVALEVGAHDFVVDLCWSSCGKCVYLLEKRGVLRKIAVPELVEECVLEIGHACNAIALNRHGLLVNVNEQKLLWVVNPDTLAHERQIEIGAVRYVASSPQSSCAFVSDGKKDMVMIDPASGKVVQTVHASDIDRIYRHMFSNPKRSRMFSAFGFPAMTPDGKYLLCEHGGLHRFRISAANLVLEELGARLSLGRRVFVSPDSVHVMIVSNAYTVGDERYKGRGVLLYVFNVEHLEMPSVTLVPGSHCDAFGFDPVAERMYATDGRSMLIVFDAGGKRLNHYELPRAFQSNAVRYIAVHPKGYRLVMVTQTRLYWMELPVPEGVAGIPSFQQNK